MGTEMVVGGENVEVSGLVALAIREKVPVEVLERLVALQERVTARDARAAFFAAVAAFQEECPEIEKSKTAQIKTRTGSNYSYTFAPLEGITRVIRPILDENALCLRHGRQRRLTEADFVRLQILLRPECPSSPISVRMGSTTSGARSRASVSTKARERLAEAKLKRSRPKCLRTSSSAQSTATRL